MALKTEKTDNLEYLNKLCEDSGIEIILPDLDKDNNLSDDLKESKEDDK